MTNTPEYRIWTDIKTRCFNARNKAYPRYGGAGITLHPQWASSFEQFYADIGPRPSAKHSLDRYPNPGGNYAPGNVRWATQKEQMNNLQKTKRFAYKGGNLTLSELAELTGIPYQRLYNRLVTHSWTDIERAVESYPHQSGKQWSKR